MATKILILVRHGQYHSDKEKGIEHLTALGRRQAKLTGKRLREFKVNHIVHSSMPRAVETAEIIRKEMTYKGKFTPCEYIRECVPGFPKHLRKKRGFTDINALKKNIAQVDRGFKKYFKTPRKDSVEVLVCHGNVIRYLVCKVLGVDTETWIKMDILQGGISVVELRSKGNHRAMLISHNDVGHIPKKMQTFL